jgi:microcystin-dependent protein
MADIVKRYIGATPKRTLSQDAFNSAMAEFIPWMEGLPEDINAAISYMVGLVDAKVYNPDTTYNPTGFQVPDFVYGSDGGTYVCIGTNVLADNPVGSVSGNWAMVTAAISSAVEGVPVGSVITIAGESIPSGYVECDGAELSRASYSELYGVIGLMYGVGDGSTTFNLPDYRGQFLRGYDHGAGFDPDAASRTDRGDGTTGDSVGTKQDGAIASHSHRQSANLVGGTLGSTQSAMFGGNGDGLYNTRNTGGNETRPTNINVLYCIKY